LESNRYSLELLLLPIDVATKVIPATRKMLANPSPKIPENQLLQDHCRKFKRWINITDISLRATYEKKMPFLDRYAATP